MTGLSADVQPELSIVVLQWDQIHHTRSCVESLRRTTDVPYELIVVDNGSAAVAREYAVDVADQVVLHDENRGFSAGMNAGLSAASAPVVAFVNNDTTFTGRWASTLLGTLRDHPDAAIVAPAVTEARNGISVRDVPGDSVEVLLPFGPIPAAVVWLMPTHIARGLGGFDERYFPAAGEDLDMAFKVWVNERDIIFDERVLVRHVGKGTASVKLPNWRAIWKANADTFLDRWTQPDVVPRLEDVGVDRFNRQLGTAASVAGWMRRYYQLREIRVPGKYLAQIMMNRMSRVHARRRTRVER